MNRYLRSSVVVVVALAAAGALGGCGGSSSNTTSSAPGSSSSPATSTAPSTAPASPSTSTASPTGSPTASPSATASSSTSVYTLAQVATHNKQADCWTAINGKVYDVTSWATKHPGGDQNIYRLCGIDGTSAFSQQHGNQSEPNDTLGEYQIGVLG